MRESKTPNSGKLNLEIGSASRHHGRHGSKLQKLWRARGRRNGVKKKKTKKIGLYPDRLAYRSYALSKTEQNHNTSLWEGNYKRKRQNAETGVRGGLEGKTGWNRARKFSPPLTVVHREIV